MHERSERKQELFELFCSPVGKVRFKDVYAMLMKERRMDERRR